MGQDNGKAMMTKQDYMRLALDIAKKGMLRIGVHAANIYFTNAPLNDNLRTGRRIAIMA